MLTSCTQQSQQQQQQQRTEGVHTEREAGHIMHVCTHFQIESICRSNHKHRPYVESDDFKIISHFQRRRTGVVLESLYHDVADVESPFGKELCKLADGQRPSPLCCGQGTPANLRMYEVRSAAPVKVAIDACSARRVLISPLPFTNDSTHLSRLQQTNPRSGHLMDVNNSRHLLPFLVRGRWGRRDILAICHLTRWGVATVRC